MARDKIEQLENLLRSRLRFELNRIYETPKELAERLHEDMGLKESTAYQKLRRLYNKRDIWGTPILPREYSGEGPRQDKKILRQAGVLLNELGVAETDLLVDRIREVYPGFEYPPSLNINRPIYKDLSYPELVALVRPEKGVSDPLAIFHPFFRNFEELKLSDECEDGPPYCSYGLDYVNVQNKKTRGLHFFIDYQGEEDLAKSFNPKADSLGSLREDSEILRMKVLLTEGDRDDKKESINQHRSEKGFRAFSNQDSLNREIKGGFIDRADYLLQKFLTGRYDQTRTLLFESDKLRGENKIRGRGAIGEVIANHTKRGLEAVAQTEDPLIFFREKIDELGIKFKFNYGHHKFGGWDFYNRDILFEDYCWINNTEGGQYFLEFNINRSGSTDRKGDLFKGKEIIDGAPKNRGHFFNSKRNNMSAFDLRSGGHMDFNVGLRVRTPEDAKEDEEDSYGLGAIIEFRKGENSLVSSVNYSHHFNLSGVPSNEDKVEQARRLIDAKKFESQLRRLNLEKDFRPWIHRLAEVYAEVPKSRWHDPSIYAQHDSNQEKLDSIVDITLKTLFTGEERSVLESRLDAARLNMRKGWASVPKLSLGAVRLPTPGQKDVRKDEFVTEAAPLFVEYMSTLGVMSAEEAERVMEMKLTNYFIHNGGFQVNRETAREIVGQLRRENKKGLEEVA